MAETVRTTSAIDEVLRAAVERDVVPGVVAMAAREDGPIYEGAAGVREAGRDDPITPDTMLRIASMTKMVTTVAALRLYEQGKLDLDAPVEAYRPEFAALQVLEGFVGDPGAIFEYGINTDWLGRVVEAIAGQSLADEIEQHVTGPLGMTSTTRRMTAEQRAN